MILLMNMDLIAHMNITMALMFIGITALQNIPKPPNTI